LAFYRHRSAFAAIPTKMSFIVFINSDIKKIIVYPDKNITEMRNMDKVERRFEFNISNDQIQEIGNKFSPDIFNQAIIGPNAHKIVTTYVMSLIESSPMHSLFWEIFNPF